MSIGILTSGGDCPGLNAVIRGAVLTGTALHDLEFVGIPQRLERRRRRRHHAAGPAR